jgi:hypothetical protein
VTADLTASARLSMLSDPAVVDDTHSLTTVFEKHYLSNAGL